MQALEMHEATVARVSEEIRIVESTVRRAVESGEYLSLDALECARSYSSLARDQLREAEINRARSESSAEQSRRAVSQQHARVRAIEKVHGRIMAAGKQDLERRTERDLDDLWLNRRESKS